MWPDVVRGRRPIEPALAEAIATLGWAMSVEEALRVWFDADYRPDLDVIQAVQEWARDGVRVVLVSNQEHRRVGYLVERWASLLTVDVAYSAEVGYVKSELPFYDAAEKRLGISGARHHVVLVDDTLDNVNVARAHGWNALHFVRTESWRSSIEDALAATKLEAEIRGGLTPEFSHPRFDVVGRSRQSC